MLIRSISPDIFRTPHHHAAFWDWESESSELIAGTEMPKELRGAALKRKAEFAAGRYCAAQAIRSLGFNGPAMVGINKDGSPDWPARIVGSITHTDGYVCAAAAWSTDCLNLGIDSEKLVEGKLAEEIAGTILRDDEARLLSNLPLSSSQCLTLVFSAKESVYKCLYPLLKDPFDFQDLRLLGIDSKKGVFRFQLAKAINPDFSIISGRFAIGPQHIHTAVELAARH